MTIYIIEKLKPCAKVGREIAGELYYSRKCRISPKRISLNVTSRWYSYICLCVMESTRCALLIFLQSLITLSSQQHIKWKTMNGNGIHNLKDH